MIIKYTVDDAPEELSPVVALQDRYGGIYSGGRWLAIANANREEEPVGSGPKEKCSRIDYCLHYGPNAGDPWAAAFWDNPPDWIAVGNSPDEAVSNLLAKGGG